LAWPSLAYGAAFRHNLPAGDPSSGVANPTAIGALYNPALLGETSGLAVYTEGILALQALHTTTSRHDGIDPNTGEAYLPSKTQSLSPLGRGAVVGSLKKLGWGVFVEMPINKTANFEDFSASGIPKSHQRYAVLEATIQSLSLSAGLGVQLNHWLSFGLSPSLSLDRFSLTNSWDTMGLEGLGPSAEEAGKLYPYTGDALFQYAGQGHHWGAIAGLYSAPTDWLGLGGSWAFGTPARTSGLGTLTLPALIGGEVIAFHGGSRMPLASTLRLGAHLQLNPSWEVNLAGSVEWWAACCGSRNGDAQLEMTNAQGEALGPENGVSVSLEKHHYNPQRLLNAPAVSIGAMWTPRPDQFQFGAALGWNKSAIPDAAVNALNIDFDSYSASGFVGIKKKQVAYGLRINAQKSLSRTISSSAWDVRLVALTDDRTHYIDERFSPSYPYTASGNGRYEGFAASMSLSMTWTPERFP
jgi:hypothetical protein